MRIRPCSLCRVVRCTSELLKQAPPSPFRIPKKKWQEISALTSLLSLAVFSATLTSKQQMDGPPFCVTLLPTFPSAIAEELPNCLQFFVQASLLQPQIWQQQDTIRSLFTLQGHKSHYVDTVVKFVSSLHDIYKLWAVRVVSRDINRFVQEVTEDRYPLSSQQTAIMTSILQGVDARDHYMAGCAVNNPFSDQTRRPTNGTDDETPWWKVHLGLGKPRTGNSQVLIRVIHRVLMDDKKVTIGAPLAARSQIKA
ncbi:hypothetical protein OS493_019913 [Desmophyllum pertusum]|uniref:Uncharacterized protein n=1 Tax=Desmophyllum pertusum TaxID=174260 RepID=A0A9W9YN18_9CNID|nr:hypothetical protein OS493_019913 [Desmophyllum pertusum]